MNYTQAKDAINTIGRPDLEELIEEVGLELVEQFIDEIDELKRAVDTHGAEVVKAAIDCDVQLPDIDEAYAGSFRSDEDFAQNMADDLGLLGRNLSWPYTCIDWTFAAKELMYDYSESAGHYFRNL